MIIKPGEVFRSKRTSNLVICLGYRDYNGQQIMILMIDPFGGQSIDHQITNHFDDNWERL